MMTFLGAVIITIVYAATGFEYFAEDFGHYCSDRIGPCLENILYQGTRNSIVGLSPMMGVVMPGDAGFVGRTAYDITYFMIMGIFILNTIVALIVDSFSSLRKESDAREQFLQTQTF